MTRQVKPSDSVHATFVQKSKHYDLKIGGRPPSVLGSAQGDHVTSYALIKHGIKQAVAGLRVDDPNIMTALRQRREKLYGFINAIGNLLEKAPRQALYDGIAVAINTYHTNRFSKAKMKKLKEFAEDWEEKEKTLQEESIGQHKKENSARLKEMFTTIARTLLTAYNKIPMTSFHHINGFTPSGDEANDVKTALAYLGLKKATEEPEQAAEVIANLFFYPRITDQKALAAHQRNVKPKLARDNDEGTLVTLLARHLYLVFSAFPTLHEDEDVYDTIKEEVVAKVLEEQWQVKVQHKEKHKRILTEVTKELEDLMASRDKNQFGRYVKEKKLLSSDESEVEQHHKKNTRKKDQEAEGAGAFFDSSPDTPRKQKPIPHKKNFVEKAEEEKGSRLDKILSGGEKKLFRMWEKEEQGRVKRGGKNERGA